MKKRAKKKVSSATAKKTSRKRPAEPTASPSPRKPKADASDEGIPGAERSFLESIAADPDDDATRLVFADWLEERGDPRAEFIRVQCELAPLGRYEDRSMELRRRQDELWEANKSEWSGPLRKLVGRIEFRRGVLEHVSAKVARFLENADKIFEVPTVRSAKLNTLKPVLDEFVKCSHLAKLTHLSLNSCQIGAARARTLLACPYLKNLTWFDLGNNGLGPAGLEALIAAPPPKLRWLGLDGNRLGERGAELLAEWPFLEQLSVLSIDGNDFGNGMAALIRSPYFQRWLDDALSQTPYCDEGIAALIELPIAESWTALSGFDHEQTTSRTLEYLAGSTRLKKLRKLYFGMCERIGDDGIQALAASRLFSQLTVLGLHRCDLGSDACEAIATSPYGKRLEELDLSYCTRIGPRGIRALLSSPHLVRLKELDLSGIRLDVARVQALAEAGLPKSLKRLILRSVDMDGAKILAASDSLLQLERLEFVWEIDKAVVRVLKKHLGRRVRVEE